MLFSSAKRVRIHGRKLKIVYQGKEINFVTQYKYLGVIIDSHLQFNENFDKSYKSISSRLRLLNRLRPYLTIDAARRIYLSMIAPLITYSSTHRVPLTETHLKQLKSVDRRARTITGAQNLPTLSGLINRDICYLVKKCVSKDLGIDIFDNYFTVFHHAINTRNNKRSIKLPPVNLEIARRGFYFGGGNLYNSLPVEIRNLETCYEFRTALQGHFIWFYWTIVDFLHDEFLYTMGHHRFWATSFLCLFLVRPSRYFTFFGWSAF